MDVEPSGLVIQCNVLQYGQASVPGLPEIRAPSRKGAMPPVDQWNHGNQTARAVSLENRPCEDGVFGVLFPYILCILWFSSPP